MLIKIRRSYAWRVKAASNRKILCIGAMFQKTAVNQDRVQFMEEYEAKGHMSLVSADIFAREMLYFIPHQSVFKPDTTKLRIVFNASAKR